MYAYGPDSDVEYDIDIDMLIDPDDECDNSVPSWIWDASAPEDEDRPDAYTSFEQMAADAA